MKKLYTFGCIIFLAAIAMSCSATLQRRYDQRHGTTSSTNTGPDQYSDNHSGSGTYKKDYGKITDENSGNTSGVSGLDGSADYNQKLVAQYAEMDKLGEVVLYELDILESRWNVLLEEYKSSKASGKQVISNELDKISDDRIVLYKAYTNIYRNGKTNWPVVKREVENTLRSVRRVGEK
ncbi:hypothetical protein [Dyadobacter pollutisoli]|uniref:Lipoprotein n=1 Tax=Dyadobacter pollutisoli TaxID=2910158 RepID=A0A9E8N687_9BACT|nr:hypothetical protein [Dyadobacter pollutisoli]WAC09322.1 hypothetical protein ON006_16340 [Dyadobacter pollutisoli]